VRWRWIFYNWSSHLLNSSVLATARTNLANPRKKMDRKLKLELRGGRAVVREGRAIEKEEQLWEPRK